MNELPREVVRSEGASIGWTLFAVVTVLGLGLSGPGANVMLAVALLWLLIAHRDGDR